MGYLVEKVIIFIRDQASCQEFNHSPLVVINAMNQGLCFSFDQKRLSSQSIESTSHDHLRWNLTSDQRPFKLIWYFFQVLIPSSN